MTLLSYRFSMRSVKESAVWPNALPPEITPVRQSNSSMPWRSAPDSWARLPSRLKQTCIENAPTFLDERNDPEQFAFDLAQAKTFPRPALLSTGDRSASIYSPVLAKLADVLPSAEILTFPGVGHVPHASHPDVYVAVLRDFIFKHER
jgi:pimeloyl-ACP methyl ester carboxylesterase